MIDTQAYGYSSEVFSKSLNTNMTVFKCVQKSLHPCALDESSASAFEELKVPLDVVVWIHGTFGKSLEIRMIVQRT